jgi:hypothetical protein
LAPASAAVCSVPPFTVIGALDGSFGGDFWRDQLL